MDFIAQPLPLRFEHRQKMGARQRHEGNDCLPVVAGHESP